MFVSLINLNVSTPSKMSAYSAKNILVISHYLDDYYLKAFII